MKGRWSRLASRDRWRSSSPHLREVDAVRQMAEPPGLTAELRPYQRRGLAWLAAMCKLGLGGCLADASRQHVIGSCLDGCGVVELQRRKCRRGGP